MTVCRRGATLFVTAALCFVAPLICVHAAATDWLSAPKPNFPGNSLKMGEEGSVKLQIVLAKDGHVTGSKVLRSSGDPTLDAAAREGVTKWKMKPASVKSGDLTTGRTTIVEFRQEPILAAVYPDRTAYFAKFDEAKMWASAPFPSYPLHAREHHWTGRAIVKGIITRDGRTADVELGQSTGYAELDQSALTAVRLWRAHKNYAGRKFVFPIVFTMGGR